jgi:hypothetical protein
MARSFLLRMRNVPDKICRQKTKLVFDLHYIFFENHVHLIDNVEIYCRAGQATDDNMVHAHCMPVTEGYKHPLTICDVIAFLL